MKRSRQLHLWIGLVTSVIILLEAVTGLLLAEPVLMGQQSRPSDRGPRMETPAAVTDGTQVSYVPRANNAYSADYPENSSDYPGFRTERPENSSDYPGFRKGGLDNRSNSLMGIVKGLHAGRIGNIDFTWALKITAVGMIILTVTGIYLSVKMLLAQRRARIRTAEI